MILSVISFAACGIALAVATVLERRADPETTVTAMFDRAMSDRTIRIAILVVWWWLGWHFLAGQTTEVPIP